MTSTLIKIESTPDLVDQVYRSLLDAISGEEQVAVGPPVLLGGLDVDRVEPLLDRAARLVGREDALGDRIRHDARR